MSRNNPRIIISGGGTGGHIFPAIAIANALKKLVPSTEVLFVGALGKMEMEKVPAAGFKIEGLWISGLERKLTLKNLMFPVKVMSSLLKSRRIIKDFQPDAVVGVGGFASGPLLYAASGMKIPSLIQEQNSYPGITNKWLSKKVDKICVAYDGMEKFFPESKIKLTGNPVRQDILNLDGKKPRGMEEFGLNPDLPTLLIVGGSLGALSINKVLAANIEKLKTLPVQILWQTGKTYYEQARKLENERIRVKEFITRMDLAYACADFVISRAGAIAVSELCLVKKACILVPFPFAAEDHQTSNAMALVNHHAAILVKDSDLSVKLIPELEGLVRSAEKKANLERNISKMGIPDSAEVIAHEILSLICK